MKKLFLLLTLIATTFSAWGATTVTKTVTQLKQMYPSWTADKCYYQPFALDDVISISSVDGTAKYLAESTPKMRYYQGNDKGYGSIIIKAKAGYVITSVKLKYSQQETRSVPCYFWYNTNASILSCDTLPNNVARSFYSNQVVLNMGRTSNATSGQIRVTEYSVTYEQATYGRFYTKSTMDLGMQYGWAHGIHPKDITLNKVLSLHSSASTLKYYGNDKVFACYQNNGAFWFEARSGATIKRVRVYYFPQSPSSSSEGVLCLSSDFGTDGKSIPSAKQIASGQTVTVNNSTSVSFNVGNKKSATGAQIRISGFQIEYTDGSSQMETFTNLNSAGNTSEVKYTGDNGYKWKVKNFTHRDTCAMYDYLGTRLNYNGYIASDAAIEGGIKDVSFDWRMSLDANITSSTPVNFSVKAGNVTDNVTAAPKTQSAGHYMTYDSAFAVKSNCAFSINLGAKASTAQARPIIGPVTITPYLLYTNKSVTIKAKDYASQNFKYTNTALINNTAGEGTILYAVSGEKANKIASINSSTGEVTILGEGTVTVTASWEGVTTSYQLTIGLETPSISFDESEVTKMVSAGSYKQTLTFTTPSSGTGIYSIVSGPPSGTIDDDGTVHFNEAGDYVIKGKFNTLPYKPDSTTYTLKVTELDVPALSFAADNVEKPVSAAGFINPFSKPDDHTGAVTYSSSETGVATVEENGNGTVTIVGAGTTTITASVAETSKYAAGNKSYSLKVFPLSNISFADKEKSVYLNADPFTYAVTKTAGDGAITYSSSNINIATVDDNGVVTLTHNAYGLDTITAIIAKTENYWADTATYTLNVSSLKLPTASFGTETVVNKVQNFESFTKTADTESDGTKHYYSSDTRVATVDETTGAVTKGEKPGTTIISVSLDASATWEALDNAAQYTLNVSSAPIADMHVINPSAKQIGTAKGCQHNTDYTNIPIDTIDKAIILSNGKYFTDGGGQFRYYKGNGDKFTIQAKAGVIIKSVKFTYTADNSGVLSKYNATKLNPNSDSIIVSGVPYVVDANAVTIYTSQTGSSANRIYVTNYEITYFDPSTGVAVTKMANDLGKDLGLASGKYCKSIAVNNVITLKANGDANLKYWSSGNINCYRKGGAIDFVARPGATIHHIKLSYRISNDGILTKYWGNGLNIPVEDQIPSDSIIYVNADSIRLYVGSTTSNADACLEVTKIYVNYTDNSEVVVDNFDNCTDKSGDSVVVAGVDSKYTWTLKKFARDNAQRMYYDQSIKLSAGGAIYTPISGALSEVAFDWHPTEANKNIKFYVKAGGTTYTVDSAAAKMDKAYTINFKKTNIQNNDTFAIMVDNASATALEIGHVSITPVLTYSAKEVTIAAKDYEDEEWKYTNNSLINNTGATVSYTLEGSSDVAVIEDASSGAVTIKGAGTVVVKATADGKSASYDLTINLEKSQVEFAKKDTVMLITAADKTCKQTLTVTSAPSDSTVTYSIYPEDGAEINSSTGEVKYTKVGDYTITGSLAQKLPYAAASDTYTLRVQAAETPHIGFQSDSIAKDLHAAAFTNPFDAETPTDIGTAHYTSSDKEVAEVAELTGEVKIKGTGKATITVNVDASEQWASASKSYIVYVKPLPEMSFATDHKYVYRNIEPTFTNTLTVEEGYDGSITYSSDKNKVAQINESTGEVTVKGAGEAIISAMTVERPNYSADTISYILTVYEKDMPKVSFADTAITKVHTDGPFTNAFNQSQSPKSTGAVSYTSSDPLVATVDGNGLVTLRGRIGATIITGTIEEDDDFVSASATFKLTVNADPTPGGEMVNGNIATIASKGNWQNNQYRTYFKIDENISVSSKGNNSQYLSNDKSVRFYQANDKGEFTIRAKAGVIIQAYKLTYTYTNDGVVTNNTNGSNTAEANRILSNTIYKCDANKLTFYTGSTSSKTNGEVHITNIAIKYFDPQYGVEVTRTVKDLERQCKLKNNTPYGNIPVNNAITLHTDDSTHTLKYYTSGSGSINCYRSWGPIDVIARKGTTINYVKITYSAYNSSTGGQGTLTKFYGTDGKNIPLNDRIASDSVLYVNSDTLRLWVGNTNGIDATLGISKIYVVYTDSTASVENFDNCPALYGGDQPTTVAGVDGVYKWKITQFNRDSLRRIGYDQSIMLRQNGGKIETVGTEGGVKEVAFDWCASNKDQGAKFAVKVGDETIVAIDSAKTGGYKPMTYSKTGIKHNGAFSIEVDATSGSQVEFAHLSLTPYLLYTEKEADIELGASYKNTSLIDNRDDDTPITYEITSGDGTISGDTVTPTNPGDLTIKASWGDVFTTYVLHVDGTLELDEDSVNTAKIASCDGKTLDVEIKRSLTAGMYNTFCLPFGITKANLETALGTTITSLATIEEEESVEVDDIQKNVNIVIEEVDSIKAGKPYLINPETDVPSPLKFSQVKIQKPESAEDTQIEGEGVTFYAIYSPTPIPANNKSVLFLVSNNRLAWNNTGSDSNLRGFRAYFNIPGMVPQAGVTPRLVFRQPATPTELMQNAQCTMQGVQKMIIDNQLIIIRNGVRYNANGQMLK